MSSEKQAEVLEAVHTLVPEYPHYHWRHLHESIKGVSKEDYQRADYLRAATEAAKKYENIVKDLSEEHALTGQALMMKSFGKEEIKPVHITNCITETDKNIEEGQKFMSAGIISGYRNPTSHETKADIHPKVFSDMDCLDILSTISYLLNKLDQRKKPAITN